MYKIQTELYIPSNRDYFGHYKDTLTINTETINLSATKARTYLKELVRSCEGHVLVKSIAVKLN